MKGDVDTLYRKLGSPGRFQVVVYIMLCCNYFPVVINHLAMAIYGARTGHTCQLPPGHSKNESIPFTTNDMGEVKWDQCHVYENFTRYSNRTVTCPHGWNYELLPREKNIILQWDLVCDRAYLSSLSTTIYFCGVMLGGLIFGSLSDRWGRKPFMLLTLYLQIAVGVGIGFADSYLLFVFLRFLLGVLMQGLQTSTFVLIMELFTPEHRTAVGTVFEVFWGTGVLWLAFVSWLIQDWHYIQLALTLPSLLTIVYVWTIPESVRWLVAHKRFADAESVLRKAAKFNGVELPEDPFETKRRSITNVSNISTTSTNKYTLIDMFRTPKLRKRSFVLFYIWLVCAMSYYGLSLSITSLGGNKYLNLFIGGLIELPAYCAAVFILNRFGRRKPLCVYLLIGGVFCITAAVIPRKFVGNIDLRLVSTALAMIGRFGMAGCLSVILLYSCELFPTVIRNVSMGACAFWMRVGGVLAPQILYLGQYTFTSLPVTFFGVTALLGSALTLLLPETLGTKLPDTVDQAENIREQHYDTTIENGKVAEGKPEEIPLDDTDEPETFI